MAQLQKQKSPRLESSRPELEPWMSWSRFVAFTSLNFLISKMWAIVSAFQAAYEAWALCDQTHTLIPHSAVTGECKVGRKH